MCCIMNIALILLYVMDIKFPWLVLEISILLTATFYTLLLYTPTRSFSDLFLGELGEQGVNADLPRPGLLN